MSGGPRYRVEWTRTAASDLEAILDYLAADNADSALRIFGEIRERAAALASLPLRGRVVPELQAHGILLYREIVRAPWRIVYRVDDRAVYVVTVCDSRRNLEDLLLDRFLRPSPVPPPP